MDTQGDNGVLEVPKDAGPPPQGIVARWRMEIELSEKVEKLWRQDAEEAIRVYRNDGRGLADHWRERMGRFNILWANVETLRPAVYTQPPTPVVSRRYQTQDPAGRMAATVLERVLVKLLDTYDFNQILKESTMDMLLPGRAQVWVRYQPTFDADGEMTYESVKCEHVDWRDFLHGPGRTWAEVTWVARRHMLTKDTWQEMFPDFPASEIPLDASSRSMDEAANGTDPYSVKDTFKRAEVWEIWDKSKREVVFVAPSYRERPVLVVDDPLKLEEFFPCPRPMLAISTTDSQVPITEYALYADQARELDRVTSRISRIIEAMKARGVYDTTVAEIGSLMRAEDNELIPAQNVTQLMERGGLDKAVWMLPIEAFANALKGLYVQREQIKQIIYEITGLSDIVRGSSNAAETATAQNIKEKYGSLRIRSRQEEVQRFARDILRLKAEVIAEQFQPQTYALAVGAQVPPEVLQLLKSDLLRGFAIDIETDSTVAIDDQAQKTAVTEFMTAFGQMSAQIGPAVKEGFMNAETAKQVLLFALRKFRVGRDVEEALEQMQPPQQQGVDPAQMQKMQEEVQKAQQEVEKAKQDIQAKGMQLAQQEAQMQMDQMKAKMQLEQQVMQAQMQDMQAKMQLEIQAAKIKMDAERAKLADEMRAAQQDIITTRDKAALKAEEAKAKAAKPISKEK